MSKKNFDDFIRKQQRKPNMDSDKKLSEWLEYVSDFYKKVEEFLSEYKEKGLVDYDYLDKTIIEKYIGSYSIKILDITFGEHTVRLEPIGTDIIGAKGRIDLLGENGRVNFILRLSLMDCMKYASQIASSEESLEPVEPKWQIPTAPPRITYKDFTQENFLDALLEVIGEN